jgi:glutamyl-tRNA synthetase
MSYEARHLTPIPMKLICQEWLPSTPKHLVLYDAFGWKPPVFVHLPLLHDMSGRKLSKRDAQSGASFMIKTFAQDGILPEALLNYVALFGWSPRTESDVHPLEDMIARVHDIPSDHTDAKFTLDGLTTGSIKVSSDKLPFLNQKHILLKLSTESGTEELVDACLPFLKESLQLTLISILCSCLTIQ